MAVSGLNSRCTPPPPPLLFHSPPPLPTTFILTLHVIPSYSIHANLLLVASDALTNSIHSTPPTPLLFTSRRLHTSNSQTPVNSVISALSQDANGRGLHSSTILYHPSPFRH